MGLRYLGNVISSVPPDVSSNQTAPTASGIWTLNQQAAYQGGNNWPLTYDPYFKETVLLLHGNGGISGATNNSGDPTYLAFSDNSDNDFPITVNGNARGDNSSPFQVPDGYWSNYFGGDSDYFTISNNSALDITQGSFTVEAFVYRNPSSEQQNIIVQRPSSGSAGYGFRSDATTNYLLFYYTGGLSLTSSSAVPANQWCHVVAVRNGSDAALFIDGVRVADTAAAANGTTSTDSIRIGIDQTLGADRAWGGYLSSLRVVKGTAVYDPTSTTLTVPTAPLTAISGTSLLTCQSNRFVDNSSNSFAATVTGAPKVQPFNPFTIDYNTVDGSGYFDGSGDYLTLTDTNNDLDLGGVQASVDFWAYVPDSTAQYTAIQKGNSNSYNLTDGFSYSLTQISSTWTLYYNNAGSGANINGTAPAANQWTHICAATDTSNNIALFINGIRVATASNAISKPTTRTGIKIGEALSNNGDWLGYMANLRFLTGANAYDPTDTTITIPTASPTNVSGTELLTVQYQGAVRNGGFIDSSPNDFPITASGNATQGTFSPFSAPDGRWSIYFDGNDYFRADTALDDLNTTTSPFTLSFWIYPQVDMSGVSIIPIGINTSASGTNTFLWRGSSFYYNDSTSVSLSSFPPQNAWSFVEIIYDGSNIDAYLNGVGVGTASSVTFDTAFSNCVFGIGAEFDSAGGGTPGNYFIGYMSNLRLVAAALSPSSVPTSPTTEVSSTTFLGLQSNRFVDNSTTPKTITAYGNPSVQLFSPFAPTAVYSTTANGGSGYFDGSETYLQVSDAALVLGTGDFSFQFWVYNNAFDGASGNNALIDYRNGAEPALPPVLFTNNGQLRFYVNGSTVITGATLKLNEWSFIGLSRVSGTTKLFVNGVQSGSSYADTNNYASSVLRIACDYDVIINAGLNGYLSGFKMTKGVAVDFSTLGIPTAPPTVDDDTFLLINFTNAGIYDNTNKNNLQTVGNAQVDTSTVKFGTGSMKFDGTGDWLQLASSQDFVFGTGDFTIEMWVNPSGGLGTDFRMLWDQRPVSTNGNYILLGIANTTPNVVFYSDNTLRITSTTVLSTGNWYHIALCRASGSTRLFINGTQEGSTYSDSTSYLNGAASPLIGTNGFTRGNSPYQGFIDDLRITKGVARYTSNFTPPQFQFFDT